MRLMSKNEYLIVPEGKKFTGLSKLGFKVIKSLHDAVCARFNHAPSFPIVRRSLEREREREREREKEREREREREQQQQQQNRFNFRFPSQHESRVHTGYAGAR